jgi:Ca2+-binding RTX toxin-like protein
VLGSVSTTLPLTVFGGSGADILEGGKALADELSGGDGSDILNSIDGRVDYLKGGGGFDLANADSVDRADDVIESRTNQ